jgi:hypothetical protein
MHRSDSSSPATLGVLRGTSLSPEGKRTLDTPFTNRQPPAGSWATVEMLRKLQVAHSKLRLEHQTLQDHHDALQRKMVEVDAKSVQTAKRNEAEKRELQNLIVRVERELREVTEKKDRAVAAHDTAAHRPRAAGESARAQRSTPGGRTKRAPRNGRACVASGTPQIRCPRADSTLPAEPRRLSARRRLSAGGAGQVRVGRVARAARVRLCAARVHV